MASAGPSLASTHASVKRTDRKSYNARRAATRHASRNVDEFQRATLARSHGIEEGDDVFGTGS